MDAMFFASADDLRAWLEARHATAAEVQVGFYKQDAGQTGISYADAVDQALCFGWIDGVRRRIDDARYAIRFTPRTRGSIWSAVNIARVEELAQLGQMRPAGLAAFQARQEARSRQYSYEQSEHALDGAYEERFRASPMAWAFFQAQAPSYRKAASWWVMSAKREETRLKRLSSLMADSEQGHRLAQLTYARKPADE